MAIAFVKDAWDASSTDTITVPAGGFAAGNLIVMGGIWDDATSTVSTMTDTAGNSYSNAVLLQASGHTLTIWYSLLTNALSSGNTIVASLAANDGVWICAEFSGIGASPLDQAPTGVSAGPQLSHTSGTTATTTQADELLLGLHGGGGGTTYTASGGFTINEQQIQFGQTISMQYLVVSSTGTYASTCTSSGNITGLNLIATFKASGAAAVITPLPPFEPIPFMSPGRI